MSTVVENFGMEDDAEHASARTGEKTLSNVIDVSDGELSGSDSHRRGSSKSLDIVYSKRTEEKVLAFLTKTPRIELSKLESKSGSFYTRKLFVSPLLRTFTLFEPFLEAGLEFFVAAYSAWARNEDIITHVTNCLLLTLGVYVLLFGTTFSTSSAFVAAIIKGSSDRFVRNIDILRRQIIEARNAYHEVERHLRQDDFRQRKLRAILITLNPVVVSEVFEDFWRCILFAGAAAKLHHAKIISLGLTLGEHLARPVHRYLVPVLEGETDDDLHRWYETFFSNICAIFGVLFAFRIVPIVGLVATAVKGAHMVVAYAVAIRGKPLPESHEDAITLVLVLMGLAFQGLFLKTLHGVPWFLQFVFFPVYALEHYMIGIVQWL